MGRAGNYKETLQRKFLLWLFPLFILGSSVIFNWPFPDEIVSFHLGKVRALQLMGYLNLLLLSCWRKARAADTSIPHYFKGSQARAANLLTGSRQRPANPNILLLGTVKKTKPGSFPEQGKAPATFPSSHSLLCCFGWLPCGFKVTVTTENCWHLFFSCYSKNKTHFPSWLKIHIVYSNAKVDSICFPFHIFLSLNNIHVAT